MAEVSPHGTGHRDIPGYAGAIEVSGDTDRPQGVAEDVDLPGRWGEKSGDVGGNTEGVKFGEVVCNIPKGIECENGLGASGHGKLPRQRRLWRDPGRIRP